MTASLDPNIDAARGAIQRHAWREAYERLKEAEAAAKLDPGDLDDLAEAAWWLGRLNECIDARERAYAAYLTLGEVAKAARAAVQLASYHEHTLATAVSKGWLKRAEHLLAGIEERAEHGLLYRALLSEAMGSGDLEAALGLAERIEGLGRRLGNADLEALGLHDHGRVLLARGEAEAGMTMLDEAMARAIGGELSPFATAVIYCNVIIACQNVADYRRAADWTEAAKRWCERQAIAGFPGMCRVRRAEVIRLRGAWAEAEQEARTACQELSEFYLDYAAEGFYQIGEIRLRVGDQAGAEEAFRQAHELGRSPQPGLALLRLAQGDTAAADRLIRGALIESHVDRLARARLLPAAVEIALAVGDSDGALRACSELTEIAEAYRTTPLLAAAQTARAACEIGAREVAAGLATARLAARSWQAVDAPYETARARLLVAEAQHQLGHPDAARLELDAAVAAFERLGAGPDLAESRARQRHLEGGTSAPAGPQRRTFMFTDIARSTDLVEAIGDEAWEALVRWHDRMLRDSFRAAGGEEVDHAGDGFFVAFPDARSAVACALEIQRRLASHRREHGFAPEVKIGLHAADARSRADGYRGRGVHVAARIADLAGPGEIVASRATLESSGHEASPEAIWQARLKGVREPLDVVRLGWR
jgi:class 3 adenylate cyclase